jgi:hypothetical protein
VAGAGDSGVQELLHFETVIALALADVRNINEAEGVRFALRRVYRLRIDALHSRHRPLEIMQVLPSVAAIQGFVLDPIAHTLEVPLVLRHMDVDMVIAALAEHDAPAGTSYYLQQMRWSRTTVQSFLGVRTAVLNDTLDDAFRQSLSGLPVRPR